MSPSERKALSRERFRRDIERVERKDGGYNVRLACGHDAWCAVEPYHGTLAGYTLICPRCEREDGQLGFDLEAA